MAISPNIQVTIPSATLKGTSEDPALKETMDKRVADLASQFKALGLTSVSVQGKSGLSLELDRNSFKPKLETTKKTASEQQKDEVNRRGFFNAAVLLVEANATTSEKLAISMRDISRNMAQLRQADAMEAASKALEAINLKGIMDAIGIIVKVASVIVAAATLVASIAATVATAGAAGPGAAAICALVISGIGTLGTIVSAAGAFEALPKDQQWIGIAFDVTMVLMSLAGAGVGAIATSLTKATTKAAEEAMKKAVDMTVQEVVKESVKQALKEAGKETVKEVTKEAVKESIKEAINKCGVEAMTEELADTINKAVENTLKNLLEEGMSEGIKSAIQEGGKDALKELVLEKVLVEVSENFAKEGAKESKGFFDRIAEKLSSESKNNLQDMDIELKDMSSLGEEGLKDGVKEGSSKAAREVAQELATRSSSNKTVQAVGRAANTIGTAFGAIQGASGVASAGVNIRSGVVKAEEKSLLASAGLWEQQQQFTTEVMQAVLDSSMQVMKTSLNIIETQAKVFESLSTNHMRARTI